MLLVGCIGALYNTVHLHCCSDGDQDDSGDGWMDRGLVAVAEDMLAVVVGRVEWRVEEESVSPSQSHVSQS